MTRLAVSLRVYQVDKVQSPPGMKPDSVTPSNSLVAVLRQKGYREVTVTLTDKGSVICLPCLKCADDTEQEKLQGQPLARTDSVKNHI